jgi:hypothetical protein
MPETHESGLVRYWFEFDVSDHLPLPAPPGKFHLDYDTATHRLLHRGVGVTGYDEDDCLALVQRTIDDELPPLLRVVRQPIVTDAQATEGGNAAWRGIWYPPVNRAGPTIG